MGRTPTSFKPGQARPPNAGRKKGTPNKKTLEIAQVLETLKIDPLKSLSVLLPQLEEDKQADVHLKLLEYLYPKRKAVEHSGPEGGAIEFSAVSVIDLEERKRLITGEGEGT